MRPIININIIYLFLMFICTINSLLANDISIKVNLNDEEKLFIKNNPIIKISNEKDWPPFDFMQNGEPKGYFIDLIEIISKRTGLKFEYVNGHSWSELISLFNEKRIDVIHPIIKTPQREKKNLFTSPMFIYKTFYATQKKEEEIISVSDLYGKKIAVIKGYAQENFLREKHSEIEIIHVENAKEGLFLIEEGKVDVFADSEHLMSYIIKKNYYSNVKINAPFKEYNDSIDERLYFMVQKNMPELASIINKGLSTITLGEVTKLEEKWFGFKSKKIITDIDFSANEIDYLVNKKVLKMCLIPPFMPYEGLNEKNHHIGVSKDLMDKLQNILNITFEVFPTKSFKESLEAIKDRKCDFMPLIKDLSNRKEFLNFTKPYFLVETAIVTKNEEFFIDKINDLTGKTLGVANKSFHYGYIKNNYPQINLIGFDTSDEGLKAVKSGKIYGYIGALGSLGYKIQQSADYSIKIAGKFDFPLNMSMGIRNDEPQLYSIFEKTVRLITKEDIAKAYSKWVGVKVEQKINYTLIYQILGVSVLIILGTMIWLRKLKNEIKKRKIIEKELEKSNLKLLEQKNLVEIFINSIPDIVWMKDTNGVYLHCNKRFTEFFGASREEIVGKTDYDFVEKELADFFVKHDNRAMNSSTPMSNYEVIPFANDGHEEFTQTIKTAIRDNDGNVIGTLGIGRDLTKQQEQKDELEEANEELQTMIHNLKQTQERLIKSEKMASLGKLVAGVAHEINTPIGIGLTASSHLSFISEVLKEKYKEDAMTKEEFENFLKESDEISSLIFSNLERTSDVIKNFKQVAIDQTTEEKREFNLKEYTQGIIFSLDNIIKKKDIKIDISCDEHLNIISYPGLYSQILTNLIINSYRHGFKLKKEGSIDINITVEEDILTLIYKDDGMGISKENLSEIFDPFFTTNREDGGSGLGLNIIYNIITNTLKGTIECNSKENEGVEFIVTFKI